MTISIAPMRSEACSEPSPASFVGEGAGEGSFFPQPPKFGSEANDGTLTLPSPARKHTSRAGEGMKKMGEGKSGVARAGEERKGPNPRPLP